MSAIIDDKVVAGAQDPNVVKEDPIVSLTVSFFFFFFILHQNKFFKI